MGGFPYRSQSTVVMGGDRIRLRKWPQSSLRLTPVPGSSSNRSVLRSDSSSDCGVEDEHNGKDVYEYSRARTPTKSVRVGFWSTSYNFYFPSFFLFIKLFALLKDATAEKNKPSNFTARKSGSEINVLVFTVGERVQRLRNVQNHTTSAISTSSIFFRMYDIWLSQCSRVEFHEIF